MKLLSGILLVFLITVIIPEYLFAIDNIITVYYDKEIGQVNKKILGNNIVGFEPEHPQARHYYGRGDYGLGIWNPKNNKSVKEVINWVH